MRSNSRIVLTRSDERRLRAILGARGGSPLDRSHLVDLKEELERARIVDEDQVAADVVTLQSEVSVRDTETGVSAVYTLVSPIQADPASGYISVLAPLGTALLGYRERDQVEWQMPGGIRRLEIERVKQPGRQRAGSGGHVLNAYLPPAAA